MLVLIVFGPAFGNESDKHQVPTLVGQAKANVKVDGDTVTVIFGPVDLFDPDEEHTPANMPKHIFELPRDMFLIAFKATVFTSDGTPLPPQYLHHISLLNMDKKKSSCLGAPDLIAGAGMEMAEARFPLGYGVKLEKGTRILATAAFYHSVPPTKGVMAAFTMEVASSNLPIKPMESYQISVNEGCYAKLNGGSEDDTDEGVLIRHGVQVRSVPVKFHTDGCVKFAYPHGHDHLVMMSLENVSRRQTLLRTVPTVTREGALLGFSPHQVYADREGFFISTEDDYEMTMIYHRPSQDEGIRYGMAIYVLYMSAEGCPEISNYSLTSSRNN